MEPEYKQYTVRELINALTYLTKQLPEKEETTFRYNFFRGGTSIILEVNEIEKYRLPVLVERSYILH